MFNWQKKIQSHKKTVAWLGLIVLILSVLIMGVFWQKGQIGSSAEKYPPAAFKPVPIVESKKIYDRGSDHKCAIKPFSRTVKSGEAVDYRILLSPSYKNSQYELEIGDLPAGVKIELDKKNGWGNEQASLKIKRESNSATGSFTVTLAYHEYQPKKEIWLTNYCLFNIVLTKE